MNEALLAILRAASPVYREDGQPDLADALDEAGRILAQAIEPDEAITLPSPANFREQDSGGRTSDMPGSAWANSTPEPNRYLHARAPRGAEARLAGEETGLRCGW